MILWIMVDIISIALVVDVVLLPLNLENDVEMVNILNNMSHSDKI